jgi:hypothetical protein
MRSAALALAGLAAVLPAQNCGNTSTGLVPISELTAPYQGEPGGLWPGGSQPPAAHAAAGVQIAQALQPRDSSGAPSPQGRIVLLSIGMSNTTQEFSTWLPISNGDPSRSAAVTVVDGARGGQDAPTIADPAAAYWAFVDQRLASAGVTPQQVQAVWLKEAVAGPTAPFPQHALQLRDFLAQIARNLRARYPNAALCFLSSRIYAGYATTALNPEPYAYESAFAVRWTIEQQVLGDPGLNFDPARGPVQSPWLGWGPYLWADGLVPRADGLVWACSDFQSDGTHPGPTGRAKVAAMLDAFFKQSPFAAPWYLGSGPPRAFFGRYGAGCAGAAGVPEIGTNSLPVIGNLGFQIRLSGAAPNRAASLLLSGASASIPVAGACVLLLDPLQSFPPLFAATNGMGRAAALLPVPDVPEFAGLEVFAQWAVDDPAGASLPPFGGLAGSAGGRVRVGF